MAALIDRYAPDVLVLEDCAKRGSRRSVRVRELIEALIALALRRKTKTRRVSREAVRRAFRKVGVSTKHQIAGAIASRFPELSSRLPPPRRPWMSEDEWMSIFDAAALGLAYFGLRRDRAD